MRGNAAWKEKEKKEKEEGAETKQEWREGGPEGEEEMEASAGNFGKKSVCFCADDFMFHMCHIILELPACFSSKKKMPQEKHHGQACS